MLEVNDIVTYRLIIECNTMLLLQLLNAGSALGQFQNEAVSFEC